MPVVETTSGRIRGTAAADHFAFKGVPYAASTAGVARFQPPQPLSWAGVRDALTLGPRAPQSDAPQVGPHRLWLEDSTPCGEDCLVLNVHTGTLDSRAHRPVMVFLHGGGFEVWSGGAPGVDGANLARRGVVIVTLNHRLNLFGHLFLGELDGGRYAEGGNAGLLDCVAALEWVRENIERFGGDPANVTLFGQSGGGSKVAALMAMPRAEGLFHRAIIQSASSLLGWLTREEAERNTWQFLRQLGLNEGRVGALRELPAPALLAAMTATAKATGRRDFRPVIDGRTLFGQSFDPQAPCWSSRLPLLIGWCEHEQRWSFASTPQVYDIEAARARRAVASALGVPEEQAQALIEVYGRERPGDKPGDLFAQILGDLRYRRNVTHAAECHAALGTAPVFMYLLRWKSGAMGGLLRAPHTLCVALAFANAGHTTGITGDGPQRFEIQEAVAGAWIAFARQGHPGHAGLPPWQPFSAEQRHTMVFDRRCMLVDDPLRAERLALQLAPDYVPAEGEARSGSW